MGNETVYDLHTHSRASDGALSPSDLVVRAFSGGVQVLSLTDHDTVAGIEEARSKAGAIGMQFVAGIELSVTWCKKNIHVIGLNIDPMSESLSEGIHRIQSIRRERALLMGQKLEKSGVSGAYEGALEKAGTGMVTRTHFAQLLVEKGLARDVRDVFNHYLKPGKPGYVHTDWAEMQDAVGWIRQAGGVAVLAHPMRYQLTRSWLGRLCGEFKEAGGMGIEVVSGSAPPGEVQSLAAHAKRYELLASCGSDYHSPDYLWQRLGPLTPFPEGLTPIWSAW
jgi:predicted metal-dependent phosphoesterase TrpH